MLRDTNSKRRDLASPLSVLLIALLAALIPLAAVMQYHWIGEITDADTERRHAYVRNALRTLRDDLNSEITKVYQAFLSSRPGDLESGREHFAERYSAWAASTTHRPLVKDVYFISNGPKEALDVSRLNSSTDQFESAELPANLEFLRERLTAELSFGPRGFGGGVPGAGGPGPSTRPAPGGEQPLPGISGGPERNGSPRGAGGPGGPGLLGPGGPQALFGPPVIDQKGLFLIAPRIEFNPPEPVKRAGWIIAELNRDYLVRDMLPHLVEKHISAEYVVRIASKEDLATALYGDSSAMNRPDESIGLLDLRFDQLFQFNGRGLRRPPQRREREREWGSWRDAPPANSLFPPAERGVWRLDVQHRAGSLEAAVARTRLQNLVLSGAIFILLALTIGMLVLTTRRAQKLARQQMEFVAGVSHELRTPLTVIRSAGENLADGLVKSDAQIRRYGALIRNEGKRLSEMVDQVFGLAGIGSNGVRLNLRPVEVQLIIDRALEACGPSVREAGCQVETEVAEGLPKALADPTSLAHCLGNLVSNAAKYGPPLGKVRVEAHVEGKQLEISVTDEGPGIDPADLPHIFEPFYRGRNARDEQIHGVGLGLSLVQRIVEAHSGKVEVKSTLGEGSRFSILIPWAAEA